MKKIPALITTLIVFLLPFFAGSVNTLDHGANGDGDFMNTIAIQSAIDQCYEQGGGTVYVPARRFRTGTIILKSHVSLYLEAGAFILGSTELKDYPEIYPDFRSYTDVNYVDKSLIYAEKAENISICGRGTIDGQGEEDAFDLPGRKNYKKRPYIIRMVECQDVRISDVSLINSAMWVRHYLACEDLVIDGISVRSLVNHNNDGIVLKATAPTDCEQICISNFICAGTDTVGCSITGIPGFEVQNITLRDIHIS